MTSLDPRGPPVLTHETLPLTPREREIVARAAQLSAERFWPRAAAVDRENRFPTEDFGDLFEAGLLGLTIPEAYGGLGVSDLAYAAVLLEIAKGSGATALCFTMHCTAMSYLRYLGSDDQRRRFYRRVLEDGALVSALGSEPRANIFSAELPSTRLERVPGGYLLQGRKIWCSLGPHAQVAFVNGQLDGRIVGALVDLDADGVTKGTLWDSLSMRGTQSVDIAFDRVFVPEADVVPEPLNLLLELEFGIGLASAYLGVAESAYRVARQAARGRIARLLESSIGHGHPDVGRLFTAVGDLRISLVPAWLMVQRAASIPHVGTLERTWALAEAKQVVAETAARVAQDGLRVVGAQALMRGPFERLFRDIQAGLVMAIKPDNATYLAGRFELGVLPDGMADLVPAGGAP
ncbi:MAG: acyl-CoA dehydrogenase family protein [Myxococcota bacterium]